MAGQIFLSYSSTDRPYVDGLVAFLRGEGLDVWYDPKIPPGSRYVKVIESALVSSSAIVVVMTPASDESEWVEREIENAENRGLPVLPLLLAGEPFFRFTTRQWTDVRGAVLPGQSFVDELRRVTGTPPPAPPAPVPVPAPPEPVPAPAPPALQRPSPEPPALQPPAPEPLVPQLPAPPQPSVAPEPAEAAPLARRRRRVLLPVLVAVLAVALGGGAWWWFGAGPGTDHQTPTEFRDRGAFLSRGDALHAGERLTSISGQYWLVLVAGGELVLRDAPSQKPLWETGTAGHNPALVFEANGDITLKNGDGDLLWHTDTAGKGTDRLLLQDNGHLVAFAGARPVWDTGTAVP